MNFIKARIKNYAFWVSLFSLLGLIVDMKYPQFTGNFGTISKGILTLIVAAGIANNPTTQNAGFGDDMVK